MEKSEAGEALSFDGFWPELAYYWGRLPDRFVYLALLAGWCSLFYFFGWISTVAGNSDSLFSWMWNKWTDPSNDASHGKLIPFVVLGLLWMRRRRLAQSVTGPWWPALFGVACALLIHVVGFVVQQPRFSMMGLFGGAWMLVGLVWGRETLKAAFFPFFIFSFCMPMGGTFAQGLTLPLRLMAAKGAEFVATSLDVHVVRVGTKLMDPNGIFGDFDVAAACSGIRSFIALLAITTIFAVLTMRSIWRRGVIIASTIPLSVICNIMRVSTIILAANAFKTPKAGEFVDEYFGYVTYAVAICGVLLLARLLKEKPVAGPP